VPRIDSGGHRGVADVRRHTAQVLEARQDGLDGDVVEVADRDLGQCREHVEDLELGPPERVAAEQLALLGDDRRMPVVAAEGDLE
jgi:hypothetical protein